MSTPVPEHVLDHVYKLFYEELHLCGCGNPEDAYALIRQLLDLTPFYDDPDAVRHLIGQPGAYHMVLGMLTHADLIEHGGGIGGSWITPKGEWFRAAMRRVTFDDIGSNDSQAGLPHDGGECTDACWLQIELPTS
jgi:hypothetical protein